MARASSIVSVSQYIIFIKLYFQGLYCSAECQKENWEQHQGFCKERRKRRRQKKEERAKRGGKGGGGFGQGGRGKQKREDELAQEEMCRSKMEVLTFSEVD